MTEKCKAIVVHSPNSGRAAELTQALHDLQQAGIEMVQVMSIAELDDLPAQGRIWQDKGIDIAIAAGGDGLVGGVISHIAMCDLVLGILPLGTANDIARSLHIPLELPLAIEALAGGTIHEIDIGLARPAEQAPHAASPHQRGPLLAHVPSYKLGFFAHALTVGLNVQFARLATSTTMRQRYGRLTYPFAALEAFRNREPLEVELLFDGAAPPPPRPALLRREAPRTPANDLETLRSHALQVAIINAPIFGGRWQLAIPGASLQDRLLDILVIEDIDLRDISVALSRLFSLREETAGATENGPDPHPIRHPAELNGIPGIHHIQAQGVTITTNTDPRDVTLDGEVRGQTPIHVRVVDERLRVAVPPMNAASL